LDKNVLAQEVWFDADNLWVLLTDGRAVSGSFSLFSKIAECFAGRFK